MPAPHTWVFLFSDSERVKWGSVDWLWWIWIICLHCFSSIHRRTIQRHIVFIRCHIRVILYATIGTCITAIIGIGTGSECAIVCVNMIRKVNIGIESANCSNVNETGSENWSAKGMRYFMLYGFFLRMMSVNCLAFVFISNG